MFVIWWRKEGNPLVCFIMVQVDMYKLLIYASVTAFIVFILLAHRSVGTPIFCFTNYGLRYCCVFVHNVIYFIARFQFEQVIYSIYISFSISSKFLLSFELCFS